MIFQQIYGRAEERRILEIRTNDSEVLSKGTIQFLLKSGDNFILRESPEIPIELLFTITDVMSMSLKVYGEQLESTLKRMKEEKKRNGKKD